MPTALPPPHGFDDTAWNRPCGSARQRVRSRGPSAWWAAASCGCAHSQVRRERAVLEDLLARRLTEIGA